jgi:hypothetical protein
MKYECKSCGLECAVDTNFEPTVCLKTGIICYGWHKIEAAAPKPLSEAVKPEKKKLPDWCKCCWIGDSDKAPQAVKDMEVGE